MEVRQLQIFQTLADIVTHILWHRDKWISPAMAAFMELTKVKLDDSECSRMGLVK